MQPDLVLIHPGAETASDTAHRMRDSRIRRQTGARRMTGRGPGLAGSPLMLRLIWPESTNLIPGLCCSRSGRSSDRPRRRKNVRQRNRFTPRACHTLVYLGFNVVQLKCNHRSKHLGVAISSCDHPISGQTRLSRKRASIDAMR